MTLNIGLKVKEPKRKCTDKNCPFHGNLSVRGKLFDGKVTGSKAKSETEQIAIDAEKMKSLDTLEDEEAKFK